jgi:DNA-binding response OmpR family regulator
MAGICRTRYKRCMRVLVVEDETDLADVIGRGLRQAGLAVDISFDGESALEKASYTEYDVVVLDRNLPGVHGDEVCRSLISSRRPPRVLMLTAADAVHEKVAGLTVGADDYLSKPFDMSELIARINALGRRPSVFLPPVLHVGSVILDIAAREVTRNGRELRLTRKEFAVLEFLMRAGSRVVSSEELLEHAWDEHADPFTNAVRITIMTLRRKLGEPQVIETVAGVGYQFRTEA